jgi:hypothetical protein
VECLRRYGGVSWEEHVECLGRCGGVSWEEHMECLRRCGGVYLSQHASTSLTPLGLLPATFHLSLISNRVRDDVIIIVLHRRRYAPPPKEIEHSDPYKT